VLALNPTENALIVGTADELGRDVCLAHRVNWIAGQPPGESFEAMAKIRYKARDARVDVTLIEDNTAHVKFNQPQRDVTPGQAIVLYQGPVLLGGGTIAWLDKPDISALA
jgi:tRNA-specific 2-thiouridylase